MSDEARDGQGFESLSDITIRHLQSRLTAAETKVKELEKLLTIAIDFIDPHRSPGRCAYNNNTMAIHLRAELDKLKGKS